MPGPLDHSPADVVRRLIVALGGGTLPSAAGPWPVHAMSEPPSPDDAVTVYDTAGVVHSKDHPFGFVEEHHGVQVRVRSAEAPAGAAKALALAQALDAVSRRAVAVGARTYCVHNVSRTGTVLSLGKDDPVSKRSLFTFNALVYLRML